MEIGLKGQLESLTVRISRHYNCQSVYNYQSVSYCFINSKWLFAILVLNDFWYIAWAYMVANYKKYCERFSFS